MINLSDEQISIAYHKKSGVMVSRGAAGSGKTLVAVERALYLADKYAYANKNDKILFSFYNKSLINEIKSIFDERLKKDTSISISKIKNDENIDRIFYSYIISNKNFKDFRSFSNKKHFISTNTRNKLKNTKNDPISAVIKNLKSDIFTLDDYEFLLDEIDWIRQQMLSNEEYLEKPRIGRGAKKRLQKKEKEEVIKFYNEYKKEIYDFYEVALDYLDYIKKYPDSINSEDKFQHIIIDESQDLSRMHFEFLKLICPVSETSSNTMNFFLDNSQSIYSSNAYLYKDKRTFKQLGLTPITNKEELRTNYRNVEEIFKEARKLIPETEEAKKEGQNLSLYETKEVGLRPIMIKYESKEEEIEGIVRKIKLFIEELGYKEKDITIIFSGEDKNYLEELLKKEKIRFTYKNKEKDSLNITTFHSVKGTEDKIVFIPSLNYGIFDCMHSNPDKTFEEKLEENKKLIYIGMTRSKEILIMSHYDKIAKELEILDFNNFLNIKQDDNFEFLFNKEYNKSENIKKENPRYKNITERKIKENYFDQKIILDFKNEIKEKSNKIIKNEIKEKVEFKEEESEILIEDYRNKIELNFPDLEAKTLNALIRQETLLSQVMKIYKDSDMNFSNFLLEYFKICESEIKELYILISNESNNKFSLGQVINEFSNYKDIYPELSKLMSLTYKYDVIKKRNDLAHNINEIKLKEFEEEKELILYTYLKKIINIKKKIRNKKSKNILIGRVTKVGKKSSIETNKNKSSVYYPIVVNDSIMALSKNQLELKRYIFSGKYKYINGNEVFIIQKSN